MFNCSVSICKGEVARGVRFPELELQADVSCLVWVLGTELYALTIEYSLYYFMCGVCVYTCYSVYGSQRTTFRSRRNETKDVWLDDKMTNAFIH